jgi:uncharacterized protein (DUF1330 family)
MRAYVIVEIKVHDTAGYEEYWPLAASVARHGDRYAARGRRTETFQGEWPGRIVLLEFENNEATRVWYHSDDYQEVLPIRLRTSRGRMIAVKGTEASTE